MKHIYNIITILASAAVLASCSNFDDLNENPYALKEAPAESYIQPIVFKTEYNLASIFRSTTAHLMQYAVSTSTESTSRIVGNYSIPEGTDDDTWTALYIQYGNACKMYETAIEDEDETMEGIALILKAMVITTISDTYGDVPFTEAGKLATYDQVDGISYNTAYDTQESIYKTVLQMYERANECLGRDDAVNFSSSYDSMFEGDITRWRRFGNSLYLRALMRVCLKVEDENGGTIELDSQTGEVLDIKSKIAEIYNSYVKNGNTYPVMRSTKDCARVGFSKYNETLNTPFYSTTSGIWNQVAACQTLVRRMLDTEEKVDADGCTYYSYKSYENGGHIEDPRYDHYYRKPFGAPTQLLNADFQKFMKTHISTLGNSSVGRMPNGDATSAITGKIYDLKNADFYSLMNYSEVLFLFAEAGARGWIPAISGLGSYLDLYKQGITQSILEWNEDLTEEDDNVLEFVNYMASSEKYSGATFNSKNAVEAIITQKWVSLFFVGTEAWNEYRRTGYPLLKTNGAAAENDEILPTRLRYPADELYRNEKYFTDAVNGWLGGSNNMTTDVWWADTQDSKAIRLLGRQ